MQGRSREGGGGGNRDNCPPPFFPDTDETFVDYLVQVKTFYNLQCYQGARKADNKATIHFKTTSGMLTREHGERMRMQYERPLKNPRRKPQAVW